MRKLRSVRQLASLWLLEPGENNGLQQSAAKFDLKHPSSFTSVDLIKFHNTGAYFYLGLTNEKYEMN